MTQPKLTAAQQRVFDWLGESEDHCICVDHIGRYRLMIRDNSPNGVYRPAHSVIKGICRMMTNRALVISGAVVETRINEHRIAHIHPKFAGGSDD